MAKKKSPPVISPPTDEMVDILNGLAASEEVGLDNFASSINCGQGVQVGAIKMGDPAWSDYVLGHFEKHELSEDGNPYVTGLRRVARLLLGPIVISNARVITPPRMETDDLAGKLSCVTVEYLLRILWTRLEHDEGLIGAAAFPVEFQEVADVYFGNTKPEFAIHPSAMAATRAEGRCLRKALQLQKVIAAEEETKVTPSESGMTGEINATQINFIDCLCRRLKISVNAFINSGAGRYDSIDDVPYAIAEKMVRRLSGYQNEQDKIPDAVKGYDPNWRKPTT